MHVSDLTDGDVETADVVDGEMASFAEAMCEVAHAGITELKPQRH